MVCVICPAVKQVILNVAELADVVLNTILLGDPRETVSRRTARAREAGERWAVVACKILTVIFRFMQQDHCTWSLEPGSEAKEVWHWSRQDDT